MPSVQFSSATNVQFTAAANTRASLMSIFPPAWIQVFARERAVPFLDGVSQRVRGNPNRRLRGALKNLKHRH